MTLMPRVTSHPLKGWGVEGSGGGGIKRNKHEIHMAANSGHLFMTYFYKTGGMTRLVP